MKSCRVLGFALWILLFLLVVHPDSAFAQNKTSWGFSVAFTPTWDLPKEFASILGIDYPEAVDVNGTEFRLGVVRGRVDSGDWGLSYVQKRISNRSHVEGETDEWCRMGTCVSEQDGLTFRNVSIAGVELHKFIPFGTIKKRAQIGITLAGGVGRWNGEGTLTSVRGRPVTEGDGDYGLIIGFRPEVTVQDKPIEAFYVLGKNIVPLATLELSAAAIVNTHLKIRVSGGFSLPGTHSIAVTGTYLLAR